MNNSGHKKTRMTEVAALFTVGFAIYQGHKAGVINPELIGQMFMQSYEVAAIACSAAFTVGRKIYTKYFRNPKSNVVESIYSEGGEPSHPSHAEIVERARQVIVKDRKEDKNA